MGAQFVAGLPLHRTGCRYGRQPSTRAGRRACCVRTSGGDQDDWDGLAEVKVEKWECARDWTSHGKHQCQERTKAGRLGSSAARTSYGVHFASSSQPPRCTTTLPLSLQPPPALVLRPPHSHLRIALPLFGSGFIRCPPVMSSCHQT